MTEEQAYLPRPVGTDHAEWTVPDWDDVAEVLEDLDTPGKRGMDE